MGSHALTRMPPVGELQQDGRLTVTDQRLFGDPDYLLRIITRDLPPTSSSTTTPSPPSPTSSATAPPSS
jgi:hypothetical protein